MKLTTFGTLCKILGFGILTGLMIYALIDTHTALYLFENPNPKVSEGFSILLFVALLFVFARNVILNSLSLTLFKPKLANHSQKESTK